MPTLAARFRLKEKPAGLPGIAVARTVTPATATAAAISLWAAMAQGHPARGDDLREVPTPRGGGGVALGDQTGPLVVQAVPERTERHGRRPAAAGDLHGAALQCHRVDQLAAPRAGQPQDLRQV